MPSHYCKCGHCDFFTGDLELVKTEISQTKQRAFANILQGFIAANSHLEKIKKSYNSETGKLIEQLKTDVGKLITAMHTDPPKFDK